MLQIKERTVSSNKGEWRNWWWRQITAFTFRPHYLRV